MPGRSQGLAEQQMAMSASMSTSQHTTSVLAYQQRYESNGAGGAARPFDISDPEGNTMTLLRNVESVYVQSMTTEDEKNKMMREKIYADDQNRKMREDIEKLSTQLSEERHRRTNEHSLTQEMTRNGAMMTDVLSNQNHIKVHDDEFVVVRDVQESSAKRGAVLSRLMREVDRIKAKQVDRKVLKQHKQALGLKSQDLQVWPAERLARAACSDLSQG